MRNRKQRGMWAVLIIAAVVIAGGLLAYKSFFPKQEKPTLKTDKADRGTVRSTISSTGVLQALTTVDVKSNVGGTVMELTVDEGARVTKGQLIAKIDPSDAQTALDQQRANLLAAQAKVDQSSDQSTMQELQSKASVEAAEQSANSARQALEGARQRLAQAELTAKSQPTLTNAAIRQAQSSLNNAQSSQKQIKEALIPQKLASAQASLEQAKANLDYANTDLARQKQLLDKGFVPKSTVDAATQKQLVAQASYNSAQKSFTTVKTETDEDLNVAQAKVEQAQAALDNAKANAIQDTLKNHDVESARITVKQAEAALKQSEASLASAKAGKIQNQIRKNDIVQAQSSMANSKALYKNAVTNLGYTTINSPCSGVVVKKFVDPGSIVAGARNSSLSTGSGVTIIQIADTTRMFALVNVDETDISKISLGQKAEITIDAFSGGGLPFEGTVTKIAPQAVVEQNVTTVPVTVEIDMPDPRFKPSMNVNCQFIIDEKKNVLRVPSEAVSDASDGGEATVKVIVGKDKWEERKIEIGFAGDDYTEVKEGLKEDDVVVTQIVQPKKTTGTKSTTGAPGAMGGPMGGGMGGGMRGR